MNQLGISGNHLVLLNACNFIVLQRQNTPHDIIFSFTFALLNQHHDFDMKIIQYLCLTQCEARDGLHCCLEVKVPLGSSQFMIE